MKRREHFGLRLYFVILGNFMLNKENRLKKRKEFGYIYNNGDYTYSKSLTLLYTENRQKRTKIGFSVSKKVGKAYLRNKIKRQLRAIIRENFDKLPKFKNYVFVAKPQIVELSYKEIERDVMYVISKVKNIK